MANKDFSIKYRCKMYHDMFVEIAVDRFVTAEKAYIELNKQKNQTPNEKTYELLAKIQKGCIETVCFSVMALESFINTFAAEYVSKSFAETIDRLDIPAKWIVTMRVSKSVELKKGEKPIQKIAQSVTRRNALIHSKSKSLSRCEENGGLYVPEFNPLEDYIIPAIESVEAIKDAAKWIEDNWKGNSLNIDTTLLKEKVKYKFKTVANTWIFTEPVVAFKKYT